MDHLVNNDEQVDSLQIVKEMQLLKRQRFFFSELTQLKAWLINIFLLFQLKQALILNKRLKFTRLRRKMGWFLTENIG